MFLRKSALFFYALLVLMLGCEEPIVLFGDVSLKVNGLTGTDVLVGDEITLTAELSEDITNPTIYWSEDGSEYVLGTETLKVGPYASKSSHTVSVKVVFGTKEIVEAVDLSIGTPVEWNGALSVTGTNIVNENGKAIQLRGLSTHGLQYFNSLYTENAIRSLAQNWHADIVRISCYVNEGGWSEGGNYLDMPDYWRGRVDSIVSWATNYGIYALIDWHQLVPGDPNAYLDEAKEFWSYMVDKHGDKPNVLFDICNEPNNDSTYSVIEVNGENQWISVPYSSPVTWSSIKKYADEIVPIIRAKSDNIIIIGTPQWASRPDAVGSNKVDADNIMYTMHFYAADHSGYINYVKNAISNGIPVFVTEFGTQSADGDQANDFIASQKWIDFLAENKISWCNWNYSNDYRSGAVFKKGTSLSTVSSYSNENNLKEAGAWIMNKINVPADDF